MRRLILVRIVHSQEDMGSAGEGLLKESMERLGKEGWEENQRRIERFWRELVEAVDKLELDYSRVRVYQDGLPAGGELGMKIVNETAARGSQNYRLVKKLIEKGAVLEATESPELLLKEYRHIKLIAGALTREEREEAKLQYEKAKTLLIEERDLYIARRIQETLNEGETGILFIGATHQVASRLPGDIEVKNLV